MQNKVTIYTLAEELGVSPSAVSRAFNPAARLSTEKRKLILSTAHKYNFSPNRAAARLSRQAIRIGAIIVNRIPAFYQPMYDGLMAGADQMASQKVSADIRMLTAEQASSEYMLPILDEFLVNQYDGVILHGAYKQEIILKVNELADAGIPVVTLHNDLPASKRLFNSTSNTAMSGALAAELLRAFIHAPEKNVIILTGNMSSQIHQKLFLAFSNACTREHLTLLQSYDTLDVPAFAQRLMEEAFSTYPDINGIYVSSANSIAVCEYLEAHRISGKVALVTSDTFSALNDYIRRGVVTASIYQDPYRQGKNAFVNLYLHIVENADVPQVLMSNPQVVLRSNLELFE